MNILKIVISVILVESATAQSIGTTASGTASTAMGYHTTAIGPASTAMGWQTTAIGTASTAMGKSTRASDYASVSIGQYNLPSCGGLEGSSCGSSSSFSHSNTAFVIGNGFGDEAVPTDPTKPTYGDAFKVMFNGDATVSNDLTVQGKLTVGGNVAMGFGTTASGDFSTAMGRSTTASGTDSTAMGSYTTASDYASVSIGQYNLAGSVTNSATSFHTGNTAFVIGNGVGGSVRSDAFKVMFNGDATVSKDLTVNGDATVSNDLTVSKDLMVAGEVEANSLVVNELQAASLNIGGQVLTTEVVTQLLNLLTQLARLTDINCISNTTDALKAAYQQHSDTCP